MNPNLLRRRLSRRFFRRLVLVGAVVGMLLSPYGASGAPNDHLHVTPVIFGTLGANGWYVSNVTVNWVIDASPPALETQGCEARTLTADTPGTTLTCSVRNDPNTPPGDWNLIARKTFKIDKVAPATSAALERQPDANGWYNRPFTVNFLGADATSGVAGCSSIRYAGPDNPEAVVSGSCSDYAGNLSGTSYSFKYDTTAPTIFAVSAKLGNRSVELAWRASADTTFIEVVRAPGQNGQGESVIYSGTARGLRDTGLAVGRPYEYRVTGVDQAANRAQHPIKIIATGALLSPAPGARVSLKSPPRLVWAARKGASYYNLQLIRGRKVLSAWPAHPGYQLRRTWLYKGRRHRLRPGVYRWYVWPGIGRISAGRYGRPLGSSTFVVTK